MRWTFSKLLVVFLAFVLVLTGIFYFLSNQRLVKYINLSEQSALAYIKSNLDDETFEEYEKREEIIFEAQSISKELTKKFFDEYFPNRPEDFKVTTFSEMKINEDKIISSWTGLKLKYKFINLQFNNSKRSTPLKDIDESKRLELSCNSDCGACGKCDTRIGDCVPDYAAASKIDDLNHPCPIWQSDRYECMEYCETDIGKFCIDDDWKVVKSKGRMICEASKKIRGKKYLCRYADHFYSWNRKGDVSKIFWGSSTPMATAELYALDYNGIKDGRYTKGIFYPSGFNKYRPEAELSEAENDPDYMPAAVCQEIKLWFGKRIFVTSTGFTGNLVAELKKVTGIDASSGIAAADALCAHRARKGGLGGRWQAILSDSTSSAINSIRGNRTLHFVNKRTLANTGSLWDGAPNRYIDMDEFGRIQKPFRKAWTGTNSKGYKQSSSALVYCNDWSDDSASLTGRVGIVSSGNVDPFFNWISYGGGNECDKKRALYCVES